MCVAEHAVAQVADRCLALSGSIDCGAQAHEAAAHAVIGESECSWWPDTLLALPHYAALPGLNSSVAAGMEPGISGGKITSDADAHQSDIPDYVWGSNSVNEIRHSWFGFDSGPYRDAKTSLQGPVPGFLAGGPTTQWSWDSRCPSVSAACGSAPPEPPCNQPSAKSYKDFNDGWPLNSWSVSDVSNGYQVNYPRLLSRVG